MGVLAVLLPAVPLNLVGTMFNGFVAFFFWLLVGMLEAVYLDARGRTLQNCSEASASSGARLQRSRRLEVRLPKP